MKYYQFVWQANKSRKQLPIEDRFTKFSEEGIFFSEIIFHKEEHENKAKAEGYFITTGSKDLEKVRSLFKRTFKNLRGLSIYEISQDELEKGSKELRMIKESIKESPPLDRLKKTQFDLDSIQLFFNYSKEDIRDSRSS